MAQAPTRPSARTYILVLLSVVSFLNFIDRQVLTILLEAVKHDLKVNDTTMGLLSGTTFALFYAGASLPLARWADSGNRRSILAGAVAIWSGLTALCGFAQSILHLAIARAGVATAESAAVPVSHSLVADLYPADRRGTVFGIMMAAGSAGIAAGLFLGGWANTMFGWRTAFVVVGLPGLLAAILLRFTVREPVRSSDREATPRSGSARELLANPLYRWLLGLAALGSTLSYSLLGWSPTFMIRVHGLTTAQIGLSLGLATGLGNAIGHICAGGFSDRLATRDLRWYAWLPAIATLMTIPTGLTFLYAQGPAVAVVSFGLLAFFMSAFLMPIYALAYRIAGVEARARASAMLAAVMSLVGLGVGPLLVGALNDAFNASAGQVAVRYSLTVIVLFNLALAGGFACIFGQVRQLAVREAAGA